jgi:hypothetical protein
LVTVSDNIQLFHKVPLAAFLRNLLDTPALPQPLLRLAITASVKYAGLLHIQLGAARKADEIMMLALKVLTNKTFLVHHMLTY